MVVDILKMSCVCDTMSYWNGMACVICWPNSVRSSDGSTCKCLLNYIVGPTPNSCVAMKTCIGGFPYDYTINKCVCGANQEYD